jgi:hypothetical protein
MCAWQALYLITPKVKSNKMLGMHNQNQAPKLKLQGTKSVISSSEHLTMDNSMDNRFI